MLYPSTSTLAPICLLKNCFFRNNLHILYKCIILFVFNICLLFLQFLHAYPNWFWEFQWLGSCFDLQRIHYQTWLKKSTLFYQINMQRLFFKADLYLEVVFLPTLLLCNAAFYLSGVSCHLDWISRYYDPPNQKIFE